MTLAGTRLSSAKISAERKVREISVDMAVSADVGHIENFADNFGAGWFDQERRQLRLQFEAVVLSADAETHGLWLSIPGKDAFIALPAAMTASEIEHHKYPDLPWSGSCRILVDHVVDLPAWARSPDKFHLWAQVGDSQQKVGEIHVGDLISDGLLSRLKGFHSLFLYTVILPTLASIIYFGLMASDVYISESKFLVRAPGQPALSPLSLVLKGAAGGSAQADAYTVKEFIVSRDALRELDRRLKLRSAFTSRNIDAFSRFAGLERDSSFEALHKYYRQKVDVAIDGASSIITLVTRAFTPDDSYRMNRQLLAMSESFVNQLNDRARQDTIGFSLKEVSEAERRDKEITSDLARLQTGGGRRNSLTRKFTEYQRLTLEKELADKILASALISLDEARNQALRKQLYLERIEEPGKPDVALEPRRLIAVAGVFVIGLIVWGVLTMLIAGIKEHQD